MRLYPCVIYDIPLHLSDVRFENPPPLTRDGDSLPMTRNLLHSTTISSPVTERNTVDLEDSA